ncbi:MAG: hypothetical protein ACLPWD_04815 [Methanobacterium sp.]
MINSESAERRKNEPENEIVLQDNLKMGIKQQPYSMYKYTSTDALQGGQAFTSQSSTAITTGGVVSRFQLPSADFCLNPSKMTISFQIAVGVNTPGYPLADIPASVYGIAAWRYFCPYFTQITFKASNGTFLVNVPNVDKYSRMTSVYNLDYNDLGASTTRGFACKSQRISQYPTITPQLAAVGTDSAGFIINDPYLINAQAGAVGSLYTQYLAESVDDPGICTFSTNTNYNNGVPPFEYLSTGGFPEPPQTSQLPHTVTDGNTVYIFTYTIRLGDLIKDSFFNVNHDVYFANSPILELTWAPINNIFFPVQVTNSARQFALTNLSLTNAFGGEATIAYEVWNLSLSYAYQRNAEIVNSIKESQMNGNVQPIVIPYTDVSNAQTFVSTANTQTSTMRITSQNAFTSLQQIYFAVFQFDTYPLINNSSNIGETLYTSLIIQQNGDTLVNYDLRNTKTDIYAALPYFLKNSAKSYSAIRYSGCIPYVFDSSPTEENVYDGLMLKGIPLVNQNDMVLTFTTNTRGTIANLSHFMFHVTNRVFYFSNGNYFTSKQVQY